MRNESANIALNQIVGTYFIRLNRLSDVIHLAYAGSNATEINFFIDIYSIRNNLLSKDFAYSSLNELCSMIFDMVVFYKNYFLGFGVRPHFYIIDSYNTPVGNKSTFPGYNSDFVIKLTSSNNDYVNANMELLKIMCDYFPDIRYIHTGFESSVVMYDIIQQSAIPSIILSKDPYASMIVNHIGDGRASWLRPRKYKGQDSSFICYPGNLIEVLENEIFKVCGRHRYGGPIGNLGVLYACTKFPARNIGSILTYHKYIELMNSQSARTLSAMDVFDTIHREAGVDLGLLFSRFNVLDIIVQYQAYRLSSEFAENNNPSPKLTDIEGLKHLNNYYFDSSPLMLDDLLK